MRIFVTDIETNGFYHEVSLFHCAWIHDVASGKSKGFRPHEFKEYLATLEKADVVVYHNGIDYDLPVLAKLSGINLKFRVFDTLVLSRMLDPDKKGGHSLKAWGYRLDVLKGEFGSKDSEVEETWDSFSEDMFEYCAQDVVVTAALYKTLCEQAGFDPLNPPSNLMEFKCRL